jgi:Dolichyl-phosphate-mannose-protein mannosyltransferase
VAAAAYGLALAAQRTFSLGGDARSGRPSAFVIRAVETDGRSSAVQPDLWLRRLIVDGRSLRFDSLKTTADWEVMANSGTMIPAALKYRSHSTSAALAFHGTSFVMVVDANRWSGSIGVERDSTEMQTIRLHPLSGTIAVEDPAARPSIAVFVVAVILFGVATWWIAPMVPGRSSAPWLILVLSGFHVAFWLRQCIGTTDDSLAYLNGIAGLRLGTPMYFPPGYPAMLGLVGGFAGLHLGTFVTLIQHGMTIVAGLWIYLLLRRLVTEELALLGGLLAGALPSIVTMSQTIMSEAPTLFAMVGAVYFAVRCAETGRVRFAMVAGVLTGWAVTARVVPVAALLPAICSVFLVPRTKQRVQMLGLTTAVTASVVFLPMVWFWYKSGEPNLADSAGLHLFNRVVTEQKLVDYNGPATRTLLALLGGDDPRSMAWWTVLAHPGVRELSYAQAQRLLRDVSIEGIRADPWEFLLYIPRLAWRELLADASTWIPAWGETGVPDPRLERPPALQFTATALRWRWSMEKVQRNIWPLVCWLAVAGAIVGMRLPQRALVLALAWVPTGYLLSSASLDYFAPRHNVPITPFLAALATLPLGLMFSILASGRNWSPSDTVDVAAQRIRSAFTRAGRLAPGSTRP